MTSIIETAKQNNMKYPIFALIFCNTLLWVIAISLLEAIDVKNFTLNVIIWVAMVPFTLSVLNDFQNKTKEP